MSPDYSYVATDLQSYLAICSCVAIATVYQSGAQLKANFHGYSARKVSRLMSAVLGKLGLQAFLKILMQQITRVTLLRISYSGFLAVLMVVCC